MTTEREQRKRKQMAYAFWCGSDSKPNNENMWVEKDIVGEPMEICLALHIQKVWDMEYDN